MKQQIFFNPLVRRTAALMRIAHRTRSLEPATSGRYAGEQIRKYENIRYETHPIRVALALSQTIHNHTANICVALSHDVVEDTELEFHDVECWYTSWELYDHYKDEIQEIIHGIPMVTDVSKPSDGKRAIRKEMDRIHASQADAARQTLKYVDIRDNLISMAQYDAQHVKKNWAPEKLLALELMDKGDPIIRALAISELEDFLANAE
jgi:(p)ppGpp synthase/HD superfamily hydrolase